MKTLVIHHEAAWKLALEKFNIETNHPESFPVLVQFPEPADEAAKVFATVITIETAAKFLSTISIDRWNKVPSGIRIKLVEKNVVKKESPAKGIKTQPLQSSTVENSAILVDSDTGAKITVSMSGANLPVGATVTIDGKIFTVLATNVTNVVTVDPITGEEGIVDFAEDDPPSSIPGIEEIPMDPAKFEEKTKIADLGDPTEHVLDVERAV